ncbi:MAG: N-acetylmuramoyl-L-alanine amidase [Saprospiraceae bacterium]|nr:N-acetylmuramoyl-L-alanine amidase [Saprospiraceae bacterium]
MRNTKILLQLRTALIILTIIFTGCKTQQKILDTSDRKDNVQNTVFFYTDKGYAELKDIVDSAHSKKQKIYVVVDMSFSSETDIAASADKLRTDLKKEVQHLVTNYAIDGLGIKISGHSQDLIETMTVETMLLKPYLVNFVIWTNEDEYKRANQFLIDGVIDLMVPDSIIERNHNNRNEGVANLRKSLKKIKPEQVFRIDMSPFFPANPGGRKIKLRPGNKSMTTDTEGCIHFITTKKDTLNLTAESVSLKILTSDWMVPYHYTVDTKGKTSRKSPWVEFRKMPREITDLPEFELLCKTNYPAKVWINGDPVKQYKTGIFFKKITLNEGPNRIRATVMDEDSLSVFYEREFIYSKNPKTRPVFPLWIDQKSFEPASVMELLSDDMVRVSFQGSKGQHGYVNVMPGKIRIKCSREDFDDYSLYKANLYLSSLKTGKTYTLLPQISTSNGTEKSQVDFSTTFKVKQIEEFPVVKVKNPHSRLTYNLAAPRLGGPIRSELNLGVILKTSGRSGDYYRIKLSSIESGFIHKDDVELLPEETVTPSYVITTMSCGPSSDADVLSIPYPESVPYEIFPEPDQNRIVVTLYGVQTASTWITHMNKRKIIERVTWQQTTPDTYKIFVHLNTSNIWGYDIKPDGKRLLLKVKYPPAFDLTNKSPLTGLKIAIEAGHGGSNTGAVGLSGLLEKDINLDLSLRLGELCRSLGANVVQVRDSDKDMSLLTKRDIAIESDADLLISIHANAGGRGYLSVAGTSTYWHNPFWAPLAGSIYDRLLELDLKEFGVVGSFNYTVTRASQMPSVLVEQAFMSHAEDEEKLADPEFRQQMAQKILSGLIDYLRVNN